MLWFPQFHFVKTKTIFWYRAFKIQVLIKLQMMIAKYMKLSLFIYQYRNILKISTFMSVICFKSYPRNFTASIVKVCFTENWILGTSTFG